MACVFCDIIQGTEPANVRYEDDDIIVFDNVLKWVPLMLLVVRKQHLTQEEFWRDMDRVGKVAVEMGNKYSPGGFRLISNFGPDGLQSQEHGHLHVIGGTFLGPYA